MFSFADLLMLALLDVCRAFRLELHLFVQVCHTIEVPYSLCSPAQSVMFRPSMDSVCTRLEFVQGYAFVHSVMR